MSLTHIYLSFSDEIILSRHTFEDLPPSTSEMESDFEHQQPSATSHEPGKIFIPI